MKYLEILKEYNQALIAESKRLDEMYSKLLNESCEEGKKECSDEGDDEVKSEAKKTECSEGESK
jgi:hypothetical protein